MKGLSWVTRVPKNKIAGPSQLEGDIFQAHLINFTPSNFGSFRSPSKSVNSLLRYLHCFKAATVWSACATITCVIAL